MTDRSFRDDLRVALPGWLAARALVALAALLAAAVARHDYAPGTTEQLQAGLLAWDGAFYRDIAEVGYGALPVEALRFFPLLPLLGRLLGALTGEGVAVVLLANSAALVAAALLHRLALDETGDEALAARAAWIASLFPAAFVLVWGYAEALFLVAAVGTFLAARRGAWGWAALAGAAAALTRPVGVLLVAPLAIEAWRTWRSGGPALPAPAGGEAPEAGTGARRTVPFAALVAVVAPVAGLAAYLAWVGRSFGDALAPLTVQGELRGGSDPFTRLVQGLGDLVGPERFGDGLHIPFAVAFVVLAVIAARRLPSSYAVFAVLVLIAALSAENLNSLERYALNAFPLLLALAAVTDTVRRERLALAVCGNGLVALAALAWLGVYVP